MKKRQGLYWLSGGVLCLITLFLAGKLLLNMEQKTEAIAQEQLKSIVLEKYPGNVIDEHIENDTYAVDLERETGTYKILVNTNTGAVISLKKTGQPTTSVNEDTSSSQPKDDSKTEDKGNTAAEPVKKLTNEEAIQIALEQISGQLDDIELESVDGVSYYFVEIEHNNGSEAEVQINAITGEIKSVIWDD